MYLLVYKYSMKLIGNTDSFINWDEVIESIKARPGNALNYNDKSFDRRIDDFAKMDSIWQTAGYKYNDDAIEWINYFPVADFDNSIVETFEKLVRVKPWMVWISRIRPGRMAPWHIDVHSKIDELKSLGTPFRFTCYIQDPSPGHASIVEDTCVYMPKKGSIYQWPSYDAWHCGMNGGLTDKYMFNYWGYLG